MNPERGRRALPVPDRQKSNTRPSARRPVRPPPPLPSDRPPHRSPLSKPLDQNALARMVSLPSHGVRGAKPALHHHVSAWERAAGDVSRRQKRTGRCHTWSPATATPQLPCLPPLPPAPHALPSAPRAYLCSPTGTAREAPTLRAAGFSSFGNHGLLSCLSFPLRAPLVIES